MSYTWSNAKLATPTHHNAGYHDLETDYHVVTIDVDRWDASGLRLEGTKEELSAFVIRLAAAVDALNDE